MRASIVAIVAAASLAAPASAAPFIFEMTGSFRSSDSLNLEGGSDDLLAADPTFHFRAAFDDGSPNLVGFFPFPGFVAYAPSSATLVVGGTSYAVQPFSLATPNGVAVSIFDTRQPFFPGFYGAGFIANPAADGAGIVGDFSGATPGFIVDSLVSTTFTGFNGAGFNNGPGCAPVLTPGCTPTPIALTSGGENYFLSFAPAGQVSDTFVHCFHHGGPGTGDVGYDDPGLWRGGWRDAPASYATRSLQLSEHRKFSRAAGRANDRELPLTDFSAQNLRFRTRSPV